MEKEIATLIKSKGINTLVTNKYLTKGCYDTFDTIISLSSSRSSISASIGLGITSIRNIVYIDSLFDFLHIYDDCYKDIFLNLIVCIDYNDLPKYIDFGILEIYNLKYCILGDEKKGISFEDLLTYIIKDRGNGVLVLRS